MSKYRPGLDDIVNELMERIEVLESSSYDFGDPDNLNNDTLVITGLAGTIEYYAESITKQPRSRIIWTWNAPATLDADDIGADPVSTYMFAATSIVDTSPVVFSSTKGQLTVTTDNLPLGTDIIGRVYAVTAAGLVGPTATLTKAVTKDTTPPPTASTPVVTAALRGVVVKFDGNDNVGGAMPSDFAYVTMHASTSGAGFTADSSNFIERLGSSETTFITADSSYSTIYVKFIAYDYSGNASVAASTAGSATPLKAVSTDLGVVLPGDIAFSDTDNLLVDGSFENSLFRTERLTFTKAGTWTVISDAAHGGSALNCAGDATSDKFLWLADTASVQLREFTPTSGKLYFSMKVKGVTGANGTVSLYVRFRSQTDTFTYNTICSKATAPTGSYEFLEGVVAVPANTKSVAIALRAQSHTTGNWQYDVITCKSVIASMLIEDAAITTAKINDLAVTNAKIESMAVGKLTAGILQASAYIIAGDSAGTHAKMDSSGFRTYFYDVDTATLTEVVRLGVSGSADILNIKNAAGDTVAGIDSTGRIMGATVDIPEKTATDGLYVYGTEFTEYLDGLSKGIVAWTKLGATSSNSTGTEISVLELRVFLEPERMYKVKLPPHFVNSDTTLDQLLLERIRYATGGAAVSTTSTILDRNIWLMDTLTPFYSPGLEALINTNGQSGDVEYRFLYTFENNTGTNVMNIPYQTDAATEFYVEDVGPYIAQAAAVTEYTSVWQCSSSEAYDGSGVARTDATYLGYSNAPLTVGGCYAGSNNYSLALFTAVAISGETTKTIATALSGATIVDVWVYVYAQFADDVTGLDVAIRANTLTAIANTTPTGTAVNATNIAEGSGKWVKITSIFDTTKRGIWFGPGASTADNYHGHIHSEAAGSSKPQIKIKYRR